MNFKMLVYIYSTTWVLTLLPPSLPPPSPLSPCDCHPPSPLFSSSLTHSSMTVGTVVPSSLSKVVRSTPNTEEEEEEEKEEEEEEEEKGHCQFPYIHVHTQRQ